MPTSLFLDIGCSVSPGSGPLDGGLQVLLVLSVVLVWAMSRALSAAQAPQRRRRSPIPAPRRPRRA